MKCRNPARKPDKIVSYPDTFMPRMILSYPADACRAESARIFFITTTETTTTTDDMLIVVSVLSVVVGLLLYLGAISVFYADYARL